MESTTSEPTKFSTVTTTTPSCTSQIVTPPAMGEPYTPLSSILATEDDFDYYFQKRAYDNELGYISSEKQFEAYIQAAINNYTSYHGIDYEEITHTISVRDAIVKLQSTSAGVRGWAVSGIKASVTTSSSS